jgi:hypothetical protein
MANEILLNGVSCPTTLATGPNGYYLGISNGKPTWLPFSTDIALVLRSRSLSVSQSGTADHIADLEMGKLDDLSDVNASTPQNGQVLTYDTVTGTWKPATVGGHPAATITQSNLPFSANPTTQVFNIPAVPVLTPNDTTGILTFNPGDGTTTAIDVCALIASCIHNVRVTSGAGVPAATANDPFVYTDLLTGIVYFRDVNGNLATIDVPLPTITSGQGFPTAVTNQATIYTDTDTSNVYYRAPDGTFVLLASNVPTLITSGNGVPAAITGTPTVYTDLSTGDVYYRDINGSLLVIERQPLPVAAYEVISIAKNAISGLYEYTYDAASSTSTDEGTTIVSYAWSATPVGTSGAATVATPAGSSTVITYPGTGSWLIALTVTDSNGNSQTVTKLEPAGLSQPLPVAAFEMTSKIALTAAFDASSSTTTDATSLPLTYAWTATAVNGTVGAAVLATPAAVTTTAVFPNDGEWQITLVVTDANGNTATITKLISVDRYITVNGPTTEINGSWFGSLQDAYNWINTNDAANASLYLIEVFDLTTDVNTITANQARVHFKGNGQVSVGFSLGAGTFYFSADNNENVHINLAAGGTAFNILSTTSLIMSHISIVDNAGIGIFMPGGVTQLTLTDCKIVGTSCACIFIRGSGNVILRNCYFKSSSATGNNPLNFFHGCSVEMYDCQVFGGSDSYGVAIGTPGLNSVNFKANGLWVECPGGTTNSRVPLEVVMLATSQIEITNSTFIARGASGNANAYQAVRVRCNVAGGRCIFANCVMYAQNSATAFWVQFPATVPNLFLLNCSIRSEGGNAIVSSTGVSNIVGSAWNPANIVECDIHGPIAGGPVTAVPAVLNGGNYVY